MEDSSPTGASLETEGHRTHRVNEISAGVVSGDAYASTLETSGSRSTGVQSDRYGPSGTQRLVAFDAVEPRFKHKASAIYSSCAESLGNAIGESDPVIRSNSFEQVKDSLDDLWLIRDRREEQFAEVINMIQGVIVGNDVACFTDDHLGVLYAAFVKLAEQPSIDDEFANEITADLLKGDLDVFREID